MSDQKTNNPQSNKRGWTYTDKYGDTQVNVSKIIVTAAIGLVVLICVLIINPFRTIGPTERGVVKTFGEVQDGILMPGLRMKLPIAQTIVKYDLTPTEVRVNIPVGEDGALSRDRQTIGIKGSYNWKFNEEDVIDIARRFASTDALVRQANAIINTAIKNVVGRYDISNIVQDQVAISQSARTLAIEQLAIARIPIEITALNLNNWDWSDDYDRMIRRTIEEQQSVLRASAEADRVEQEQRRIRIEAEASAAAAVAKAEGEKQAALLMAEARIAEGRGINEYNRLVAQNQAFEIRLRELEIQKIRAERWDGREIPTYLPLNPAGGIVTLPATGTGR